MKILIVSDTHRNVKTLEEVIKKVMPIDMLTHLGGVEGKEDLIRSMVSCPVHIVAGNNDFFCDLPKEESIRIGKYNVLLTHGHYYYVFMGTAMLKQEAVARGYDIVMFGHTHRPVLEIENQITVLNPGSISYPRQENHRPSYMIMELDREGEAHYTINYL